MFKQGYIKTFAYVIQMQTLFSVAVLIQNFILVQKGRTIVLQKSNIIFFVT